MLVLFSFKSSQQRSHKSNRLNRFYLEYKVSSLTSFLSEFWSEGWTECIYITFNGGLCPLKAVFLFVHSYLFTPVCVQSFLLMAMMNSSEGHGSFFLFLNFKPCLVHAALLGVINLRDRNLCKPLAGTSVQQLARYLFSQLASRHDSCLALVSLRWASTSVICSCSFFFLNSHLILSMSLRPLCDCYCDVIWSWCCIIPKNTDLILRLMK